MPVLLKDIWKQQADFGSEVSQLKREVISLHSPAPFASSGSWVSVSPMSAWSPGSPEKGSSIFESVFSDGSRGGQVGRAGPADDPELLQGVGWLFARLKEYERVMARDSDRTGSSPKFMLIEPNEKVACVVTSVEKTLGDPRSGMLQHLKKISDILDWARDSKDLKNDD